ncbi:MAG: HAD family hydrolase [Methanomassiliicoccales archaeon]|nr:MAG: HAD family hydrolase [Methanomassiliicoccales archaeon]
MDKHSRVVFFDAEGTLYVPREGKSYSDFWDGGDHTLKRATEHFELNDGVLQTLGVLIGMNCILVVVSTHRTELLPALLRQLCIREYFTDIVINGDKGENMMKFLKARGIPKERALIVGDSYLNDILPAERVGIRGFLLDEEGKSGSGRTVRNIPEVVSATESTWKVI